MSGAGAGRVAQVHIEDEDVAPARLLGASEGEAIAVTLEGAESSPLEGGARLTVPTEHSAGL